jgi:hypothetical protein
VTAAEDRELLTMEFDEEVLRLRPDVYCKGCVQGTCFSRHKVQACVTCGAMVSTAHTHVQYIPHEYVRDRLDQVDSEWKCEPVLDEHGVPVLQMGCVWVLLTVAGKTVRGVGDGGQAKGARYLQTALTYAFKHAAEQLGVGRYLRLRERERPPVEEVTQEAPAEPDPPAEGDKPEHLLARIVNRAARNGLDPAALDANFLKWSVSVDQPDGVRLHEASAEQLKHYLELLAGKG